MKPFLKKRFVYQQQPAPPELASQPPVDTAKTETGSETLPMGIDTNKEALPVSAQEASDNYKKTASQHVIDPAVKNLNLLNF